MHLKLFITIISLIVLSGLALLPAQAQPPDPDATYIVQPGDSLSSIAQRHNLRIGALIIANDLKPPYTLYPNQTLRLPLGPLPTPVAASPSPITRPQTALTPTLEVKEGLSLPFTAETVHTVKAGETLFSIAALYTIPMGHIILANGISNPDILYVGQPLLIPDGPPALPTDLPLPFTSIELSEPVIIQGRTLVVYATLSEPATLRGEMEGRTLSFLGSGPRKWAIIAIHALAEPGQYPIMLTASMPDGREVTTFYSVTVINGPYGTENIELAEGRDSLLDPTTVQQEWQKVSQIWSQVTFQKWWRGPFSYPVDSSSAQQVTSPFGTRRTYNNGPPAGFHGGTDFGGGTGRPIYAPAAGWVVLAEPLQVRGNAVLIDHGFGLYSGYWHQSDIVVTAGQEIQTGDLIGYIGDTGLVTGPHLHWEMRLHGFAVEPLQWIQQNIP